MWNKLLEMLGFVWVRQRDEKGKYIQDNKKTKHKNIKTYTLTMNKMQRHIYHIRNTRKSIAKKYMYSRLKLLETTIL